MVQVHIKGQDGKSKLWNRPTDTSFTRGEFHPYGDYLERQRITFNPSGIYTFHYKQIAERPPPPLEDTTLEEATNDLEALIDEFNDLNASNVSEQEMGDWWNRESFIYENRWPDHLNNQYIKQELQEIDRAVDNYIYRPDAIRDPLPKPEIPDIYDPRDEQEDDHDPDLTPAEVQYAERVGLQPRLNTLIEKYDFVYGRLTEEPNSKALHDHLSEIYREIVFLLKFMHRDNQVRYWENKRGTDLIALPDRDWDNIFDFLRDFKRDILIPTFQILDDLGILRTATFFTGAYLAHKFADPMIEKVFKTQVGASVQDSKYKTRTYINDKEGWSEWKFHESKRAIDPHAIHNAFSQALGWSARWTIGVPMYEIAQQQLYPEQALIRSTPQEPIYWKEEFWGLFKRHGVTYWNLRNQGYNYKANTLALRAYLESRGEKLLPIGKYSRYH